MNKLLFVFMTFTFGLASFNSFSQNETSHNDFPTREDNEPMYKYLRRIKSFPSAEIRFSCDHPEYQKYQGILGGILAMKDLNGKTLWENMEVVELDETNLTDSITVNGNMKLNMFLSAIAQNLDSMWGGISNETLATLTNSFKNLNQNINTLKNINSLSKELLIASTKLELYKAELESLKPIYNQSYQELKNIFFREKGVTLYFQRDPYLRIVSSLPDNAIIIDDYPITNYLYKNVFHIPSEGVTYNSIRGNSFPNIKNNKIHIDVKFFRKIENVLTIYDDANIRILSLNQNITNYKNIIKDISTKLGQVNITKILKNVNFSAMTKAFSRFLVASIVEGIAAYAVTEIAMGHGQDPHNKSAKEIFTENNYNFFAMNEIEKCELFHDDIDYGLKINADDIFNLIYKKNDGQIIKSIKALFSVSEDSYNDHMIKKGLNP
jgi:hypothetical protein